MLLFQLIAYSITVKLIVWPLAQTSADDLASLIVLSAQTLATAPPGQPGLVQIGTHHPLSLALVNAPVTGEATAVPFAELLQEALSQKTGQPIKVYKQDDTYSGDIPVANHTVHFSFPHSRIGTDPFRAMGLMFGVTLLLSLGGAITVAFALTGHLRNLGRAAARVGQGHALELDAHAGVEELDELVDSFNHMAKRIQALLQNHTTLLAGISHDLRSPLTRAKIALELAEAMPDATTFTDLGRYLAQLESLIAEFLDFSRGVVPDANTSLELAAIIAQVCRELSVNAAPVQFTGEPLHAVCNHSGLQRVIRNLIENAQRYGNAGVVEVALSSRNNAALIEVHDRGPGIAQSERERVFLPFVRLEASRNPATGGSGLGLAIVKEICRVHYWKIALLPRREGGLTVSLEIPLSPKVPRT